MTSTHWGSRYNSNLGAELWWFEPVPAMSMVLLDELDIEPDAAVVDIGGGNSRLVDMLLDRGFRDVTVVDICATALDHAKRRLRSVGNRVQWLIEDVRTWQPPTQWDVWHDRAAFHFMVDPSDRAAYLRGLRNGLVVDGAVVLGTFAVDGPESCSALPSRNTHPYRETEAAIASAAAAGIHAVEREAAALYAYAQATSSRVVCIAHVTNSMAVDGDDFEKGEADGTYRILALVNAIADRLEPPT